MADKRKLKKRENQKLLDKINAVYSDAPDAEERMILQAMKKKQFEILKDEKW